MAVDLTDLMPTLLDVTGQGVPRQAQGQSLVPFLTGQREVAGARQYSFSERVQPNPQRNRRISEVRASFMIRGQGWKYVRYAKAGEYLYHLTEDPGETRNLANDPQYRSRRDELAAELDAWLRRTGRRTKGEGPRAKDQGRRTKDETQSGSV